MKYLRQLASGAIYIQDNTQTVCQHKAKYASNWNMKHSALAKKEEISWSWDKKDSPVLSKLSLMTAQ
jgi:hypothetical protein